MRYALSASVLACVFALCLLADGSTGVNDVEKLQNQAQGAFIDEETINDTATEENAALETIETATDEIIEPIEEPEPEIIEYYYEPEPVYYAPAYSVPTDGLTPSGGVNYYDGRTETYYSSNVLYHYRTDEWIVDDEGFYRTAEGFYVVAASDMEQGTVFQGSKGDCIVLDCGCSEGVTDYYVAW